MEDSFFVLPGVPFPNPPSPFLPLPLPPLLPRSCGTSSSAPGLGGGGGGGGGGGIGGDRGISWDDPLLTDSSIFVFIEKVLQTYGRTY